MADDDKELKDQRVVTMMTPSELEGIDDWMFKNRIRSRGEAIRRLVQIGMNFDKRADRLLAFAFAASKKAVDSGEPVKKAFGRDDLAKIEAKAIAYEMYGDFLELTMDALNEIGLVFATSIPMRLNKTDLRALIAAMSDIEKRLNPEGATRFDRLAELKKFLNIPDVDKTDERSSGAGPSHGE